jgi:Probable cobalt transporter subunit (CbtB)
MAEPQLLTRRTRAHTLNLSSVRAALWLSGTVFLALLVMYFVGLDQGATSVFGSDSHIHEFMHDARHLLGFPCH